MLPSKPVTLAVVHVDLMHYISGDVHVRLQRSYDAGQRTQVIGLMQRHKSCIMVVLCDSS